jgi:flagellar basal body-associated protein FliL
MSGDKKDEAHGQDAPKKGKGPLLWIILAVVLGLGGAAAGIFLAPKFMHPPDAKAAHGAEEEDDSEEEAHSSDKADHGDKASDKKKKKKKKKSSDEEHEEPPISVSWAPLVVDLRDETGAPRHLKLVITVEVANEKASKEMEAYGPRGRSAVLSFVRQQKFEYLVDATKFEELQEKLLELVQEKIGEERITAVWITDLVAQ